MRSSRGYLDALVRSARPAARTSVHAVAQPDWGPTHLGEPSDEPEALDAVPVTSAHRTRLASLPVTVPPQEQSADASPPSPLSVAVPRHPEPPAVTVVRAERPTAPEPAPISRIEERTVLRETDAPPLPAPTAPTPPAARPVEPPTARTTPTWVPTFPAGTEVSLKRLEHLARRFPAALPVVSERPATEAQPTARDEAPAPREARTEPTPVVLARPAPIAAHAPEPARVEIGSIEVFVTQPPVLAPVAASVPPARVVAAPAARPERLSRPAQPYGFGQA
ncbi:hypothetical protein ACX80V_17105 [Arthrobacter sp. MDT3-24]